MFVKIIKNHIWDILLVGIALYSLLSIVYVLGCVHTMNNYKPEMDKLKQENRELREQNRTLSDNQVIIYHADNFGGTYESESEHLRVTYPDGRGDCIHMKDELKERIQNGFEDYADELKVELKELGVDYE